MIKEASKDQRDYYGDLKKVTKQYLEDDTFYSDLKKYDVKFDLLEKHGDDTLPPVQNVFWHLISSQYFPFDLCYDAYNRMKSALQKVDDSMNAQPEMGEQGDELTKMRFHLFERVS